MTAIRIGVAFVGIALSLVAIARNDRRVAWIAIAVLAIALALRFVARRQRR